MTCGKCEKQEAQQEETVLKDWAEDDVDPQSETENDSTENLSNSSLVTENDTCPAQLRTEKVEKQQNISFKNISSKDISSKNISKNVTQTSDLSTGKAILLLEELEEKGLDTDSIESFKEFPLIASKFEVLGKDAFSLSFLNENETTNGTKSTKSPTANETTQAPLPMKMSNETASTFSRLVSKILDLWGPSGSSVEEENETACPEGWEQVILVCL